MDRKELAKFTLEPPTKSVFEMAAEGTIGKKQKDIYESKEYNKNSHFIP